VNRVQRLLAGARKIADPDHPLGRRARAILPRATGLSLEGVELALTRCLETAPSDAELCALSARVPPAPHAHVLLSANVFVAAHRAIALALAQSADVAVRPSRREPEMPRLLAEACPGLFRLVDELAPTPGDHVWAYGSDETLSKLRGELPAGIVYHAHGHGIGLAVVDAATEPGGAARALADDVIAFDQRGCLSPRIALVIGDAQAARDFAVAIARELARLGHDVPRGSLDPDELADIARYRDSMLYAAELLHAGKGYVGLDAEGRHVLVPPVGRNLHVVRIDDPAPPLAALGARIAAIGVAGPPELERRLSELLPRARLGPLGSMQRPPFDGPVDLRSPPDGELL
jgi:hypothetical protein